MAMIRRSLNKLTTAGRERNTNAYDDYNNPSTRGLDNLRTDITESLGANPSMFAGRYRRKTNAITEKISAAESNVDKVSVRERYLEYRNDRATVKADRLQQKINNSPDTFWSRQINRQRRQTIEGLQRKSKYRNNTIAGIETKRRKKPEELQKQIDKLIRKKVDAQRRKAERIVMKREAGIGLFNPAKKAKFLADITPEQKQKIVREAILLVRKSNIESGVLEPSHEVDSTADTRSIGREYHERVIE